MNKKLIISLGLVAAMTLSTAVSMADSNIYTDGIGRMHFLGKDPASNTVRQNYSNAAEQDLTRRLYENSAGELNYVDHKVKDYDNTFGIGKMDTQTMWKNKFSNNVDDAMVNTENTVKGSMTFEKGAADASRANAFGATNIYDTAKNEVNIIQDSSTKKTHWWQKSK